MRIISRLGSGSLRAVCTRTRLLGFPTGSPHCSYNVFVPLEDLDRNAAQRVRYLQTFPGWAGHLAMPVDAFLPAAFNALPALSRERLEAWHAAEDAAMAWVMRCASQAFPELAGLDRLPTLWLQHDAESSLVVVREPAQVAA